MTFSIRTLIFSPMASRGKNKNIFGIRRLASIHSPSESEALTLANEMLDAYPLGYREKIVIVVGPIQWAGEKRPNETKLSKGEKTLLA